MQFLLTELTDELGVAVDREKKDVVFTLNNMVLFPFTEMGKIVEKTGLWRNSSILTLLSLK